MSRIASSLLTPGLLLTFTLLGCSWIDDHPQEDSWYKPLPSGLGPLDDGWHTSSRWQTYWS